MANIKEYTSGNTMREVLRDNSLLIKTVGRFGIALGFGDKTVEEVCRSNDVDTDTFITVCNLLSGNHYNPDLISLHCLMSYLKRAHASFLDVTLPRIRMQLIEAINTSGQDDVAMMLLKFYDEYVSEVQNHMDDENNQIFSYIEGLISGNVDATFRISLYSDTHDDLAIKKLNDLKDIFIYHYKQSENQKLSSTLFDIVLCEKDLLAHFEIETNLLIPAAKKLEDKLLSVKNDSGAMPQNSFERENVLSDRELEIIKSVAKGWSNKEIADKLCISTHTVATHRRNINAKLSIHSPAALAIYAVINGIVSISELSNPSQVRL